MSQYSDGRSGARSEGTGVRAGALGLVVAGLLSGCGTGGTMVFGWVGTAMNVLPRWTLTTEPHKKPRYTRRVALEVAKRAGELRQVLGVR